MTAGEIFRGCSGVDGRAVSVARDRHGSEERDLAFAGRLKCFLVPVVFGSGMCCVRHLLEGRNVALAK